MKYNFLRIFEFSADSPPPGAIAFETAKIAYIAVATQNKHLAQELNPSFFLIYRYTTLDFLAISQFRIIYSF